MEPIVNLFKDGMEELSLLTIYGSVLRIALPVLALFVVFRSARSLLTFRPEPEVWAWLRLATGELLPVTHWENVIGRKKSADIVLDFATVSKNHAVLTRQDDGTWTIRDVGARGKVQVNGKLVGYAPLAYGDTLSLAGLDMVLERVSGEEARLQASARTRAGKGNSPGLTLILLTVFQLLTMLSLCMHMDAEHLPKFLLAFGVLIAVGWALFFGQKLIRRSGFEVETIALFLTTVGLAVTGSKNPDAMEKQLIAMGIGLVIFLVIGFSLRTLERAQKVRYLAAAAGVALLLVNLVFGVEQYGAKNWIYLGGFSFQPSAPLRLSAS